MADDKSDNKSFFTRAYEIGRDHWGEIITVGTLAHAFFSGRVSDAANEDAKKAAGAMGIATGGKGDPTDEAFFKWAKSKIGNNRDRALLKGVLTRFTPYAFQLRHPEKWVCERGQDAFEEWRRTICRMGQPRKYDAVTYLTEFARDIKCHYASSCRNAGVEPWPFDEQNPDHRIAMREAFDYGIEQMQSEGTYVPTGTEAAILIKLKNLAKQMGPKGFAAGKTAYDKAKKAADKAYQHMLDHGPAYADKAKEAAENSWAATKITAAAHADWMEQQAIKSEERRVKRSFRERSFFGLKFKTPTIEGIYRKLMPF